MDDLNVWAKPPRPVLSGLNGRPRTSNVRYTWTGPIDPQLYGDGLKQLTRNTDRNLSRLEKEKKEILPSKQRHLGGPAQPPFVASSWHDSTVMFAPWGTLSTTSRKSSLADDASTVSSISGATNFCYLCSTLEEHQMHLMRTRIPKKVVVKKPRIVYRAPVPKVKPKIEEPKEILDWRYKVVVWTGDVPGATTDANVYISLKGDLNFLYKARLCRGNHTQKFCFCRGSRETFFIKSPRLGNLEILSIEHDGLEKRHSWYCEKVEITCMKTHRQWVFTCKNWLSLHHGDYSIRRDLLANQVERTSNEYELTVVTGTKRMAGTDANVFVTFHGTDGFSPKIKLTADGQRQVKNLFEKGSQDKFHLAFKDIGEIRTVRVEHDGKGLAAGWFLDRMILQNIKQPSIIYYFLLNGWLAKDVGDGHLWREIRAKKKLAKEITTGKPVSYQVTVRTGDVRYAGTDANVYIIIHGKKGKTKKLFMDDTRDNFERGQTEVFEVTALDTGEITRIQIGHDNSGPGAGWFCEDIKIKKFLNRENVVEFLKNLKKKKKPKKKHKKRLSDKLKERALADIPEDVTEDEESESEDDDKEGSYRNVFDREGKVVKVPVYEEYFFVCKNWLATDEADGLIERELEVKKQSTFFQDRDWQST
ncbi:lipoxygenase homology domain-containing protein 1 isoform X2 [Aplysia californica]|uniref:Lipoxygenase homology domain-containing protein 1 isoform X2 n=1 Tax=Aplysia californica TaxID=6500 RepID=A0ABM0JCV8_APLCA|nr:lipoxygenase homology domain-containing protein 1 isoform X2 [Aplysia californica]